nr:transposase [Borreliella garinii]
MDVKNNDKTKDNKKEVVGIDMSMRHFLVSSEGEKINHPKYLLKNENKLKTYQRKLSKKQKGFINRAKSCTLDLYLYFYHAKLLQLLQVHLVLLNFRAVFLITYVRTTYKSE